MNIGLYISPAHAVPPLEKNILAPWVLVGKLADGLVALRHHVTLFAAKGSKTDAELVHGGIEPTVNKRRQFGDPDLYRSYVIAQELALMREAIGLAKAGKLDLLHIHQPVERLYPALLAMPAKFPIVFTFHDPILPARFPALEKLIALGNIHFVTLSRSQQTGAPFPFSAVVPNGVDTSVFVPAKELPRKVRPLLITGRIVPQKGFTDAIAVSRESGERLLIVGKEYERRKETKEYFENEIKPAIDGHRVFLESVVSRDHLVGHYQTAKALLFPIHWEEPFGLVMIEAMACGTPVIAYDSGSVSEIVRDGLNGFIIEEGSSSPGKRHIKTTGIAGLIEAVRRIDEIDRSACSAYVRKHFTLELMTKRYSDVYASLVARRRGVRGG